MREFWNRKAEGYSRLIGEDCTWGEVVMCGVGCLVFLLAVGLGEMISRI